MRRALLRAGLAGLLLLPLAPARQDLVTCGTDRERLREELFLARQAVRQRAAIERLAPQAVEAARPATRDVGHIVIMESSDGVVAARNLFDLQGRSIVFRPEAPAAAAYRFETPGDSYDRDAAAAGARIENLGDDDSRLIPLPFAFPFFGSSHTAVFVNSDGNLTFGEGDSSTSERSLGRMTAGPPRISPLFRDLDPSVPGTDGVRVLSRPDRFVVSWVGVPVYSAFGTGARQTFQVRLYPDGRVEFAYLQIAVASAVVGIGPGGLRGSPAVVDFTAGSTATFTSTVAERFGNVEEIDLTVAAQKFYETHDDAYDFLIFYNNMGIPASPGAIAFEMTVRNVDRDGFGDIPVDIGTLFGSSSRLQAVVNMGHHTQYSVDPNGSVQGRPFTGDTPLSVIGHEVGHLFLAFASIRDPGNPDARPMLGRGNAHWSFVFNSEASLLEGNRIADDGANASPRFRTVATVEGYSALDQYLMGFRAPEETPPTFLVESPSIFAPGRAPQVGVSFNGSRRNIAVEDIIEAEGRRVPSHEVAQRRYRAAIILVTRAGVEPTAADLAQIETYRNLFGDYFARAASNRASMDTTLAGSLKLSSYPAAGVIENRLLDVSVSIAAPRATPVTVLLRTESHGGAVSLPDAVTIPAGAASAAFRLGGLRAGVVELIVEAAGGGFETAVSRIRVAPAGAPGVSLEVVSGNRQPAQAGTPLPEPLVVRAIDIDRLPFAGLSVRVEVTGGGSATPQQAVTDAAGRVSFAWTPGAGPLNQLRFSVTGAADAVAVATAIGQPTINAGGVVNAANFLEGLVPNALGSVFGANLSTVEPVLAASLPLPSALGRVRVLLNGNPAGLIAVMDQQINFLAPASLQGGQVEVVVETPTGRSAPVVVRLLAVQPGIFVMPGGDHGAVVVAGTGQVTRDRPARPGEILEVYATGLGPVRSSSIPGLEETQLPVRAFFGGREARVLFSGMAPGFAGLNQVNLEVPAGLAAGVHRLEIEVSGARSNAVEVLVQ